jgi:hypothetical protein
MRWRRWLALFGVLALGFSLWVFFTDEWPAGYDPLPRCSEESPASLWEPPIRIPRSLPGQLAAKTREKVSVAYSIDSTPPGVHCSVRRCRLKRPGHYGEYLVTEVARPGRPIFKSANFFVDARAKDYVWVPAYGGGLALFFTVLFFGLFLLFRTARWFFRRIRHRRLRPET